MSTCVCNVSLDCSARRGEQEQLLAVLQLGAAGLTLSNTVTVTFTATFALGFLQFTVKGLNFFYDQSMAGI